MNVVVKQYELPDTYSASQLCSYHSRDKDQIAESVHGLRVRKGVVLDNTPIEVELNFQKSLADIVVRISKNGTKNSLTDEKLTEFTKRILGLNQNIDAFEKLAEKHTVLHSLISQNRGLRIPVCMTPFEALSWAITGQQISVSAALSVRRKLIQTCHISSPSELLCYPSASNINALSIDELRAAGFSQTKATTLKYVANLIDTGELNLDVDINAENINHLTKSLSSIRGIGPWTVNYTMLRGYAWMDCSLHGDVAIQRAIKMQLNLVENVTDKFAAEWLSQFSPWRSLLAIHLWESLHLNA